MTISAQRIYFVKNRLLNLGDLLRRKFKNAFALGGTNRKFEVISGLEDQDLSRFSEQDIILESEEDIQKYLPDVLGQALARTWIDKRFLDAFFDYPVEIWSEVAFTCQKRYS